jgi:hypothetical protein
MAEYHPDLIAILRAHGGYVRKGTGGHEIWYSPVNRRHVTVPCSTKSRHSAMTF